MNDQPRYWPMARFPIGQQVIDSHNGFRAVDYFKTREVAEYHARLLNAGLAVVNPHAIVGCRIETTGGRS